MGKGKHDTGNCCQVCNLHLYVREPGLIEYLFPDFDMGFVPGLWPVAYTQVGF